MFLKNIQSILQERFFFKEAVDFNNDIADDEDDDLLIALADGDNDEEITEEKLLNLLNGLGDGTEISAEDLVGDGSLVGGDQDVIAEAVGSGPEENMTPTELSEHMATYLLRVDALYEAMYGESAQDPDTQEFVEGFNITLAEGSCGKKKPLSEDGDLDDDFDDDRHDEIDSIEVDDDIAEIGDDDDDLLEATAMVM